MCLLSQCSLNGIIPCRPVPIPYCIFLFSLQDSILALMLDLATTGSMCPCLFLWALIILVVTLDLRLEPPPLPQSLRSLNAVEMPGSRGSSTLIPALRYEFLCWERWTSPGIASGLFCLFLTCLEPSVLLL